MPFVLHKPSGYAHYKFGVFRHSKLFSEGPPKLEVRLEIYFINSIQYNVNPASWDLVNIAEDFASTIADGDVVRVPIKETDFVKDFVNGRGEGAVEGMGEGFVVGAAEEVLVDGGM